MATKSPSLAHLARPGAQIAVRVTPRAARNHITTPDGDPQGSLRVYVTTVPEDGKANDAVRKILAKALGVPKTSLTLLRGATSRDKLFRIDRA